MSLRKRSRIKDSGKKDAQAKAKQKDEGKLRLIKTDDIKAVESEISKLTQSESVSPGADTDARKKLIVYHRINELYQEDSIHLEELLKEF